MSSGRSRSLIVTPLRTSSVRHAILTEPVTSSGHLRPHPPSQQGEAMVFAHGIGGAKDLPIPAEYAMAGAGAALAVSFIVLALAWRTPRFDAATHGRPAPAWLASLVDEHRVRGRPAGARLRASSRTSSGPPSLGPDLLINPTFGVVYVLLWVGIVPMSLLFGPFYKAVSPLRTIHLVFTRLTGGRPRRGPRASCRAWVGLLARGARPARVRVARAGATPSSTYLSPVRLWFAALHRDRDRRRRDLRQRVARARRPVRGLLDARRPPLGLRSDRRDGTRWCSAARSATSTGCAPRPASSAWSRCCSAAPPSTASRTPTSG